VIDGPGLVYGLHWGGSGINEDNDGDYLELVQVLWPSDTAFFIDNQQSKIHNFIDCQAVGGKYGVVSDAQFLWLGGFVGAHSEADFWYRNPTPEPLSIIGTQSEASAKFIKTGTGASGNGASVLIEGVRAETDRLAPDHKFIEYSFGGGLKISSSLFG